MQQRPQASMQQRPQASMQQRPQAPILSNQQQGPRVTMLPNQQQGPQSPMQQRPRAIMLPNQHRRPQAPISPNQQQRPRAIMLPNQHQRRQAPISPNQQQRSQVPMSPDKQQKQGVPMSPRVPVSPYKTSAARPVGDRVPVSPYKTSAARPVGDRVPVCPYKTSAARPVGDRVPVSPSKTSAARPVGDRVPVSPYKTSAARPVRDTVPVSPSKTSADRPVGDRVPVSPYKTSAARPVGDRVPVSPSKTSAARPVGDRVPVSPSKTSAARPVGDTVPVSPSKASETRPVGDTPPSPGRTQGVEPRARTDRKRGQDVTSPRADPDPCQGISSAGDRVTVCPAKRPRLSTEPQQPIFSRSWQFQESFSSGGGQLQGADSDVVLSLPENAIVADSQRVTIYGAVSTDLDSVQEKLKLCEEEVISSPVVEYFAGEMFSFRDTVCISLPHFLPPGVAECEIKVYQAHQDDEGKIYTELLRCSADTEPKSDKRAAEESTDVVALGDATSVGTFCLSKDNRINILTRHFTGYFCTVCRKQLDPYLIAIRLYGEHVRRLTQEVDLNLFIGDQRLNIRDFRKTVIPDATKEQTFVACQTLAPVPADDVASVQLGVSLGFLEDAQTVWVHKRRPGGAPLFPAQKRLDLLGFSPCCCKEPKRVEWALYLPTGTDGPQWFEGFIDIGFVKKSDTSFQFLPTPSLETLRPQLRLINGNETHGTQTDPAMAEDTYVKRFHGHLRTSVAARATSSSVSPPDTTAEGPSETAASQSVSSPDTVAPGRLVRQDSSQIAANASSRELWHTTSQETVQNTTVFNYCSFRLNRNRNTHNNNIKNLQEMNFDNNYNSHAEPGRAVDDTSFQEATSLGLEEIMEGSLALMVPEERLEPLETQPHGNESEPEDDMEFQEPE
ncbi:uncharacterized protein [Littorina saxatilis]|uniref:uncharacterized protein n=1 Tax=Littorina saxatilis TaxID=31220 RepID=UPI0038B43B42